jgi:hypothetical protein
MESTQDDKQLEGSEKTHSIHISVEEESMKLAPSELTEERKIFQCQVRKAMSVVTRVIIRMSSFIRGPFEKFVDWRQCAAVMPPSP